MAEHNIFYLLSILSHQVANWGKKENERYSNKEENSQNNGYEVVIILELPTWASKDVQGVKVIVGILASAQPAPVVAAFRASHMVTSVNFLSAEPTFGALDYPMEKHVVP